MNQLSQQKNSLAIKREAYRLGFEFAGISKAGFLEEEAERLDNWLKNGMHGEMHYMENYYDKRLDPTKLVDGAKSVVSLMFNYFPDQQQTDPEGCRISKYAYGKDYHYVVKEKLKELLFFIRNEIGEVNGRGFVDSAPVLDRAWARKSGLGWIGKNANLIHPKAGSYFFIAELIIDLELEPDGPIRDYCGTCSKCIDACPTGAIIKPQVVDGSKCISYFTIELKNEIPSQFEGKTDDWMFGCDVCQDVCPWNRFSTPHKKSELQPDSRLLQMTRNDWEEITEEIFSQYFKQSPLKRTGIQGLKKNLKFISKRA